jgi:predicted nucleotidyltransferase
MGKHDIARALSQYGSLSLADVMFPKIRQRVLGYLFGQPERSFYASELIHLVGGGTGSVQRELARLAGSGLVTISRQGARHYYQANPDAPIYTELCSIARKTVGLAGPLREALAPLAHLITVAFVYGSVARSSAKTASDIDVLVLSAKLKYADIHAALQVAEDRLGRTVNPTIYSPKDWRKKSKQGDSFVSRVTRQPKLFLIGTEAGIN